jgi:hypothetical protein
MTGFAGELGRFGGQAPSAHGDVEAGESLPEHRQQDRDSELGTRRRATEPQWCGSITGPFAAHGGRTGRECGNGKKAAAAVMRARLSTSFSFEGFLHGGDRRPQGWS